jgi:hypothetical protein
MSNHNPLISRSQISHTTLRNMGISKTSPAVVAMAQHIRDALGDLATNDVERVNGVMEEYMDTLIAKRVRNAKGDLTPADGTLSQYQKYVRAIFRDDEKKVWWESVTDKQLRQRLDAKWEAGVIRGNFGPLYEWAVAVVEAPSFWTDEGLAGAKLLLAALMVVTGRRGADLRTRKYTFTEAGVVDGVHKLV